MEWQSGCLEALVISVHVRHDDFDLPSKSVSIVMERGRVPVAECFAENFCAMAEAAENETIYFLRGSRLSGLSIQLLSLFCGVDRTYAFEH